MKLLKAILLASGAMLAFASVAGAADLPTRKGVAPAPEKPNCYATFWSWMDSTPKDCPLSYWGVTFYGTIDMGVGYASNRSKFNGARPEGIQNLVSRTSHGAGFQLVPGGLSQSNVGIKWKEQIVPDWYFIGDVNAGFDPYSLQYANGPRSLAENNTTPQFLQSSNGDSSRAYGPINTRAYAGLQNKTFGTLTYGRQYAFANDIDNPYDPFGGAYAFSLIGASSSLGSGLGNSEMGRYTNSIKYLYEDHGVRVGAMTTVGGYSAGNNAQLAYNFDLGFDYNGFSFDGVYEYGKDVVQLGLWGTATVPPTPRTLKATISNQSSFELVGKYKWDRFTLFGGYKNERLSDPSDLPGVPTIGNFNGGYQAVYGTGANTQGGLGQGGAFPSPKVTQIGWVGGKFAALPNLDLIGGYYHVWQNNYSKIGQDCSANTTVVDPVRAPQYAPQGAKSSKCAGSQDAISGAIDWKPYKRLDVYAGVMYSKVHGGLANGFFVDDNLGVSGGVRFGF